MSRSLIPPFMRRSHILMLFGALLIALAVVAFLAFRSDSVGAESLNAEAARLVSVCTTQSDHQRCYEHEIPPLYGAYSIPQLFQIIRQVRTQDPTYQFCHVLAHELGEEVVAKDPSKWLDAIPLNPSDGMCSNGFIHGVIVGRFRNDVLDEKGIKEATPDFSKACEPHSTWKPTPLDQAICYHGLGHLYTFVTNADLPRALAICKSTTDSPTGSFLRVCSEGVFMQIYQPLEPDDFELVAQLPVKPTAENYRTLCAAYTDPDQQGACLREAWPLLYQGVQSGTGVKAFCSGQPAGETDACYETASAIVGRMSLMNSSKAVSACNHFPSEQQLRCFTASAQAIIEEDRKRGADALALCKQAPQEIANGCIQALASRAQFIFGKGSSENRSFCVLIPQQYQTYCIGT